MLLYCEDTHRKQDHDDILNRKRGSSMFSYHSVKEHPKLLLAMTGLTKEEFDTLLVTFAQVWAAYMQQEHVNRPTRQRKYGAGQQATTLVAIEDKLLFILYYYHPI